MTDVNKAHIFIAYVPSFPIMQRTRRRMPNNSEMAHIIEEAKETATTYDVGV